MASMLQGLDMAGGLLRTPAPPTLNLILLLRASVHMLSIENNHRRRISSSSSERLYVH